MEIAVEKLSTTRDSKKGHFFFPKKELSKPLFFQPKLTIGPTDDAYEREADAVADKVIRMGDSEQIQTKIANVNIQRKCAACEEGEEVQRKGDGTRDGQRAPLSIVSEALRSTGNPLDNSSRSFMEGRFGYDFSNVKIHTDRVAAKSAESINALAYTSGNSIVFNEGQYAPDTVSGRKLLAHELTHVVQQKSNTTPFLQRMLACPDHLNAEDAVPPGWKPYHGNPCWFHCCYRGILEDRPPSPSDPMNECFYDNRGVLVDENHADAGCRGTPDSYDSESSTWDHIFNDPGGIWEAGWSAFWASRAHGMEESMSDWGTQRHPYPDGTWNDEEGNMHMGPGPKW